MKVVIMAGGKGMRFWPRSVEAKPKQFLALTAQETMLQLTYRRFAKYVDPSDIYVVTGHNYMPLIRGQLPEMDPSRLILEPELRDTGPCIALTAQFFLQQLMDDVLVTAPSDQYIPDDEQLMKALRDAEKFAQTDKVIVTLGIAPTRPEIGYGYIRAVSDPHVSPAKRVTRFIEKPTQDRVLSLLREPDIYWNSGIYIWKPSTIASYMNLYQKEMWDKLWLSKDELVSVYASLPQISVDYAILEKADNVYMIPVHFVWDDVGSWTSLERVFPVDEEGNLFFGDVLGLETRGTIVFAEQQKVLVIGVDDLIIVSTKDGLLVCRKSDEQNVKRAIQMMESKPLKPEQS